MLRFYSFQYLILLRLITTNSNGTGQFCFIFPSSCDVTTLCLILFLLSLYSTILVPDYIHKQFTHKHPPSGCAIDLPTFLCLFLYHSHWFPKGKQMNCNLYAYYLCLFVCVCMPGLSHLAQEYRLLKDFHSFSM